MENINNLRKRKDPAIQSGTQELGNDGNDDRKKAKKMKRVYDNIMKKITDINRSLLTVGDLAYSLSDLQSKFNGREFLLSWVNKDARLVRESVLQTEDDCWTKALAGGLFARMVKDGRKPHELPTAELLLKNIDPSLLLENNAIRSAMDAVPSILQKYNYRMFNHTRPSLKYPTQVEEFDKFVERRSAIVPLAACFSYVPSYNGFNSELGDQKVFRATPADIASLKTETLENHCVVITGNGAIWIDGEYVEFWQIQESRGEGFADKGFTRFERHKGLIREVYEFVPQYT